MLPLGDNDTVQIGMPVYVTGNPRGLEGTFSDGLISAIREVNGRKLFQMTAPVSPGSSGGPVLNSSGEVIGITVSQVKDGQNLNFAVPVNYLKELAATTVTEPPGQEGVVDGRCIGQTVTVARNSNVRIWMALMFKTSSHKDWRVQNT